MTEKKTFKAQITIYPRPEIRDPRGKAIGDALSRLGYSQLQEVRSGKSFELRLSSVSQEHAEKLAREMSERLLANQRIEDFRVEVREDEP